MREGGGGEKKDKEDFFSFYLCSYFSKEKEKKKKKRSEQRCPTEGCRSFCITQQGVQMMHLRNMTHLEFKERWFPPPPYPE